MLPAGASMANPVTTDQARQKASQFLQQQVRTGARRLAPSANQLQLIATGTAGSYYLFAAPADGGYVVVSGEDSTEPILGYSHTGTLRPDNLPCGMQVLLDSYERQIASIRQHSHANATLSPVNTPSGDFTLPADRLTTYNQKDPYNLHCPEVNGKPCLTGCIATAMAGLMYYHQWPKATTTDIPAYLTDTLKLSVSGVPAGTPINWEKIGQHYTPGNTQEEGREDIAALMKMAGASVRMNYFPDIGKAFGNSIPFALKQYFCYETSTFENSSDYTAAEWAEKLRKEIAQNGPVIYGGSCFNGVKENGDTIFGGHCFLLEGYDSDGKFYVNFGYSGDNNDKFLLTVANDPFLYIYKQSAIFGVRPRDPMDNVPMSLRLWSKKVKPRNDVVYKRTTATGDFDGIDLDYSLVNYMPVSHAWSTQSENKFDIGVTFKRCDKGQYEQVKELFSRKISLACGVLSEPSDAFTYGSSLSDGLYDVFMVSRETGKDEWCLNDNSQHAFAKAWVCGDRLAFKSPRKHAAQLSVSNITRTSDGALTVGQEATFTYKVGNLAAPAVYNGAILVKLVWHDDYGQQQERVVAIDSLNANGIKSLQSSFSFIPPVSGDMELHFLDRCWELIDIYGIKVNDIGDTPDDPDDPNAPDLTDHIIKYWFDNNQELAGTLTNISGALQIDVSALSDGLHTLHMAVGATGSEGEYFEEASRAVYFEKHGDESQVRNRFYVDGEETTVVRYSADNSYTLALPVDKFDVGLHSLTSMIETPQGERPTILQKEYFTIDPTINGVDYWLNSDRETLAHSAVYSAGLATEETEVLLPVRPMPLRTGNFWFDMENGTAVTYAMNDISLQFTTGYGPMDNYDAQYIDASSRAEVNPTLLPLNSGVTEAAPVAGVLKWYCLKARKGDTIGLKASRPCTMQLYSPATEVIYKAKGNNAMSIGEVEAKQSGTYYLALYDLTDNLGQAGITVNYYNTSGDSDYILGDANNDGKVTITDAVAIVNYILGNASADFNEDAADVSSDGKVTISDAVGVVNIILNSGSSSAPKMDIKEIKAVLE